MGKLSAVGQPTRLTQPSIHSGLVMSKCKLRRLRRCTRLNGRLWLRTAIWLQAKVRDLGLGLRPRLYTGSACHVSAAESQLWQHINEPYFILIVKESSQDQTDLSILS